MDAVTSLLTVQPDRPHGLDELEGAARHLRPNSLVMMPAKECLAMIEYIRKLESERTDQ